MPATESGAFGAIWALIVTTLVYRELSWTNFRAAIVSSVRKTSLGVILVTYIPAISLRLPNRLNWEMPMRRPLITGAAGGVARMVRARLAALAQVLRLSDVADMGTPAPNEEIVRCNLADAGAVRPDGL